MKGLDRRKMQGRGARRGALAGALALVVLALASCGDEEETAPAPGETTPADAPSAGGAEPDRPAGGSGEDGGPSPQPPPEDKPSGPAESGGGDPRVTELERAAERTVRAFVVALDERDGERACGLFAPGALRDFELPHERRSCARSLEDSTGYRDPRGLPVWEGAEIAEIRSVELSDAGETATVVATVITRFADRAEPSIEDDVIYLGRLDGRWLISKPSSTLHRAIGAEPPPSVIAPPG